MSGKHALALFLFLVMGPWTGCDGGIDRPGNPLQTGEDAFPASDAGMPGPASDGSVLQPDSGAPPPPPPPPQPDSGAPPPQPGIWQPAPGTSWQWQLSGTVDTSLDVQMFDIDLFENSTQVIAGIQAKGSRVVCYFSTAYEDWRPDSSDFPSSVLGNDLGDWPGEKWVDIRSQAVRDIMIARLDLAQQKGCDGVEPDNVDAFESNSGFPLTASDSLDYLKFLSAEAHARGLAIAFKNNVGQISQLVSHFDFAVNEECFQYDECDTLLPFINANKAVFHVEYGSASLANTICPQAQALGFDTLIKNLDLDVWRIACP